MKLLVLLSRFPHPLDKGDKVRAFHQLRELHRAGFHISLFALHDEPVPAASLAAVRPLCRGGLHLWPLRRPTIARHMSAALAAGRPLQVGYFYDPGAQRYLDQLRRQFQPGHIYCQLVRMAEYLRPGRLGAPAAPPGTGLTLDYMDVFSAGMARRVEQAPAWQRPLWRLEARRLGTYEAEVFGWFGQHTIISAQDRQLVAHPARQQIQVVANGIDQAYFQPRPAAEKTCELLFCGNMAYPPNVDAACFLAEEILPLVHRHHPAARLLVAGTTPTARVRALARHPGVRVSGWLPDIRAAYAAARVFVAPMRRGTGLQNKLLEALAMQLPCVTTPLANNALGTEPGRHLRLGESAAELAAAISGLLSDEAAAARLARAGHEFVRARYDWASATAPLLALLRP